MAKQQGMNQQGPLGLGGSCETAQVARQEAGPGGDGGQRPLDSSTLGEGTPVRPPAPSLGSPATV